MSRADRYAVTLTAEQVAELMGLRYVQSQDAALSVARLVDTQQPTAADRASLDYWRGRRALVEGLRAALAKGAKVPAVTVASGVFHA